MLPFEFKAGTRIRLILMPDDPEPIPPGTSGTVIMVQDLRLGNKPQTQVTVKWDNGRSLSCICPPDVIEAIE